MALAHGTYTVEIKNQIIWISLAGSFNQAGAVALTKTIKENIARFKGKPFSIMVNDTSSAGNTPEAYEELNAYNEWLNKQNMLAKALVVSSSIMAKIHDAHLPAKDEQNICIFNNVADALSWLTTQSQLAKHTT